MTRTIIWLFVAFWGLVFTAMASAQTPADRRPTLSVPQATTKLVPIAGAADYDAQPRTSAPAELYYNGVTYRAVTPDPYRPAAVSRPALWMAGQRALPRFSLTNFSSRYPATYPPVAAGPAATQAYRPPMPAGYYYGQGLIGQPKLYVPGQPVRNLLRYITP